ncbi:MAG: GNAT family N-acetyltransferase [Gammaproteobacteria bacterium]
MIKSLSEISRDEWNQLLENSYPFLRYEFLSALEKSGAVGEHSGWLPKHCLVYADSDRSNESQKTLLAAMPLYEKNHSHGEYVFDHDWAHSYQHYGLEYFPKWLTSIPFTPCEGERILIKNDQDHEKIYNLIIDHLKIKAGEENISSWHCLFPVKQEIDLLKQKNLIIRQGVQFRWSNKGYADFEDFLSTFTMKKRKNLRRERRWVKDQEITLQQIPGSEINDQQWQAFFNFYQMTYLKRRMTAYLDINFFRELGKTMPEQLLLVMAKKDGNHVGAALSLIGGDTLYGRYWGCYDEYHSLHFEACYYQGLEYCIDNKLQRFDSGAQGEHKISRGFEPVTTYSAHWIKDPKFSSAIDHYVKQEAQALTIYKQKAAKLLPFKNIIE